MDNKNLILIGGGGHCKACIDVIETCGEYNILGILDDDKKKGSIVGGYPIIGTDDDLKLYAELGYWFLITVGQIKSSKIREKLYRRLIEIGANLATIVSPTAHIAKDAYISEGSIIMHFALVNSSAKIGVNCIINSGCIIEHDVEIGNNCHISTNAVINGNCRLYDNIFIGSNSVIVNGVIIYNDIIVGAGSVVIHELIKPGLYVGSPAKVKD